MPFPLSRDIFGFRCDSDLGQFAALKAGFGLGFCQVGLGKREGLTRLVENELGFELGIWLVMHKDLKSSRRVRLLFEHLATALKNYVVTGAVA